METQGFHTILDLWGIDSSILDDMDYIKTCMKKATYESGATIVSDYFFKFQPLGVSGVIVIAESHLSIHTWPEAGYASIDFYSCGNRIQQQIAIDMLIKKWKPSKINKVELERGKEKICVL